MPEIGRLLTAMVTPFDASGAVDYELAGRLAGALVDSGSDGVVVSGTTGESPTLSAAEKVRLFREVKSALGSRGTVVAGVGNYSTAESVELAREAEHAGADGLLLVVPYYNKPPQEGLYRHFKTIAESTSLPCILYNVPTRTITNMLPETVLRLRDVPNVVGIKEASGNLEQVGKIIADCGPEFRVWSGNDGDTFPIVALGGYGVVSVTSHLVGRQIKQMIELTLAGQLAAAAAIHHRLMPITNAMFLVSNPIPVKYAVNRVGYRVGAPRLPLIEPDAKTAAAIDAELARTQIDLPVLKAV